jgi:hypothetical protein
MNILYVGPYRVENDIGIESQSHIQNLLASKHTVTTRPIYTSINDPTIKLDILPCESRICDSYDVLIQHAPVDWLQPHQGFVTNIAIPILGPALILRECQVSSLKRFNKILVANTQDEVRLVRSGLGDSITRISYPILPSSVSDIKDQKIDFGVHNKSLKFYFFGNMHTDADIIQKILVSFYTAFRGNFGRSLILLLDNVTNKDKQQFMEIINSIKQQLKIHKYPKSTTEYVMFKSLSFQEKLMIHNTCDVFLSLNSTTKSTIQEEHAKYLNNVIINTENLETVSVPRITNEDFEPNERVDSIITESLVEQIKLASMIDPKSQKYTTPNTNYLANII